jgi:hypothetical protein
MRAKPKIDKPFKQTVELRELADTLNRELTTLTARAEIAERQVQVLAGLIDGYRTCLKCPAKSLGADCSDSSAKCRKQLGAWSRAKAWKAWKDSR